MHGTDRSNLHQRQVNAIACIDAIAGRAADLGIECSFHPNSPAGSVFRIKEDYLVLLDSLDSRIVGFAPDAGHIAKGGMDAIEIFNTYRSLIKHIHFKDITTSGGCGSDGCRHYRFPTDCDDDERYPSMTDGLWLRKNLRRLKRTPTQPQLRTENTSGNHYFRLFRSRLAAYLILSKLGG